MKIEKIDNSGNGIGFINDKIVFVRGALPGDEVNIKIDREKKKFAFAHVEDFIKKSDIRISSLCEYSDKCGGCEFMSTSYDASFDLKVESLKNYFKKNSINNEIITIKNPSPLNYRNKISLKVVSGKIGFYESSSKKIVEIKKCMIASNYLNDAITKIKDLNIKNGFVTLKNNYEGKILASIVTNEKINCENLDFHGVILNHELIHGERFFFDKINDLIFEVSYDAFFQVNPFISSELFNIINKYITNDDVVLDLYCGVGTLGINASRCAKYVYGIETVKSAVINANNNALINKCENVVFKVGDLSKNIKVNKEFNTLIIDPPRSGIDKPVMEFIFKNSPEKIIYVSCDYHTFVRDIKILNEHYNLGDLYVLDMFSYSHHLENLCVLERR